MAIQPTMGMIAISPWTISFPAQPGSWNGQEKLSPTEVTAVECKLPGPTRQVVAVERRPPARGPTPGRASPTGHRASHPLAGYLSCPDEGRVRQTDGGRLPPLRAVADHRLGPARERAAERPTSPGRALGPQPPRPGRGRDGDR